MGDLGTEDRDSVAPQLEQTELGGDRDDDSHLRPPAVRIAALDAEHLRNTVAARLFGAAADPVKIARFTVLKRLGAGGMGVVYSAYDDQLDRKIAIKLLRSVDDDSPQRDRLLREAQALAKLSHPNVVTVYEVGTFRGQVYVAMEFVEGKTLRDWEPSSPQHALAEILDKFIQAGRGLAAAHAAGLVHRDFKPDNVLVSTTDGRVRVLDFGLARGLDEIHEGEVERTLDGGGTTLESTGSLNQPLTRTGAILGTPAYMAPEQHLGLRADARTDQFAFCVALWEKLYGDRPFHGRDIRALAIAVTDGKLDEPDPKRGVPPWLRRAIVRGLSVDPNQRWPDMNSLLAALAGEPRRRRRWWVVGAATLALAAAAAGWAATREQAPNPCDGGERELAGVWDDEVRAQVHRAFQATGVPFAEETWASTAPMLDAYADEWVTMHREVCEASVVRNEESPELFGRRMVCLGQRLTELEQLTKLLAAADDDIVSRAVVAAGSLTQIETCADERSLLSEPIDPERLAELERLLASASGRKALGKYDQGHEIAEQAVAYARELGSAHGEGRALLLRGDLEVKRGQIPEAKASLREALRRADVAGDDATRVQALTQLMRVAYLEHELDEGEALAEDARAALERLGSAPLLEADFYLHYASLALGRDEYESAQEYNRRAISIREEQLGADHPEVAIPLNNIANALIGEGRNAEAEQLARRALDIFETKLGHDHLYTAAANNNIGNSLLQQGRAIAWDDREAAKPYFRQAAEHYRQAAATREANLGGEHPSVGLNLHNLGEALRRLGEYEEAREVFERSLAIKRKNLDASHPSVVVSTLGLGRVHFELGNLDEALRLLEQVAPRLSEDDLTREVRGEGCFVLAQILVERSKNDDPASREATLARARELGRQSIAAYEESREEYTGEIREVQRWLANL